MIDTGDKVPNLDIELSDESATKLHDLLDKPLVLYFYPRDNTPGCTTEAKEFSALQSAYEDAGYRVVGASRDTMKSHHKFIEKHALTTPLIADPEEVFCNAFGVIKPKNMYGKKVKGIERSTYVIEPDATVRYVERKVKAAGHAQRLLDELLP